MSINLPAITDSLPRAIRAIRDLGCGRSNATGSFTLAANPATTTTVTAPNMGANSTVSLSPTNANAVAAGAYISAKSVGQFVVTHTASALTRTFDYAIQG